jgi:hypothetical protein
MLRLAVRVSSCHGFALHLDLEDAEKALLMVSTEGTENPTLANTAKEAPPSRKV